MLSSALMLALSMGCSDYDLRGPADVDGTKPGQDDSRTHGPEVTGGETKTGIAYPPVDENHIIEEWWIEGETIPADIIFFGDTSGSMGQELEHMGDNVTTFVERLSEVAGDWHLMAETGGNDGCSNTGILTPMSPNLATQFTNGITEDPIFGFLEEAGLQALTEVLFKTNYGLCNEGFLRDEALLHMIIISDEPDQSWGSGSDPNWWQGYVEEMQTYKDSPSMVKISSVVGDMPDGCESGDAAASAGDGYVEAADMTGGEFISICSDWATQLEVLAEASVQQELFYLGERPVQGTIKVYKNLVEVSNWEYLNESNAVRFTSDPPDGGDEVRITYEPS